MHSVELDQDEECIEDTSDPLFSPGSSGISGIYGDPEILPRIGDQYQVEIPPLATELYNLHQKATDTEGTVDVDYLLQLQLPIPVMWIHNEIDGIKCEPLELPGNPIDVDKIGSLDAEPKTCKEGQMTSISSMASKNAVESSNKHALDNGEGLGGSECNEFQVVGDQMDVDTPWPQEKKATLSQNCEGKGYIPVPGSLGDSWSDAEQESFLLGLYIFGKNLVQLKRFIESKEMGDILSFYYGKFYGCDGHRRWSECRKVRSRRFIHGQRIFMGWRQHELLSRLLPHVSEECQNTLEEITKTFGEGKISIEEYVNTLRTTVGMKILVEAVGIGKGKHDLTSMVMEPVKTNQVISVRSEIPIGKACSSLTAGDIIKFLTGDFRLSKARSNDLFWEAVWPRLLARGWHSEQPKNHGYLVSKHPLVFLIPGIKKFSRRKLVKGNHYFDSVSDVLGKVASDPTLLELEVEAAKGGIKEENGWETDSKLDPNEPSNGQRHCYLRPRVPDCNSELMKFTVVDTSLVHGEEPLKVRGLRTLPMDSTHTKKYVSSSSESDSQSQSSEELVDEPDLADMLLNDQGESYPTIFDNDKSGNNIKGSPILLCSGLPDYVTVSKQGMPINKPDSAGMLTDNQEDRYPDVARKKQPDNNTKSRLGRRIKSTCPNYLSPVSKRQRIKACTYAESGRIGPGVKDEPCSRSNSLEAIDIMAAAIGPSMQKISTSSSAQGSRDESSECAPSENCFGDSTVSETVLSHEELQPPRALIDLNLPHVPPDFETSEPFEVADNTEDSEALRTSNNGVDSAQPPVENARRQSTRNRPLTTRALEALACGYLGTKRKGRGTKALPRENSLSRPSRHARGNAGGSVPITTSNSGNVGNNVVDSKLDGLDEECSSNTDMVRNSQIKAERQGTHDLLSAIKTTFQPEILTGNDHRSG